jgi:hypothetical protein
MITEREWNFALLEGVTERISSEFPDAVKGILKVNERYQSIALNTVGAEALPGTILSVYYNVLNAQGDLDKLLAQQAHDRAVERLDPNRSANQGARPS